MGACWKPHPKRVPQSLKKLAPVLEVTTVLFFKNEKYRDFILVNIQSLSLTTSYLFKSTTESPQILFSYCLFLHRDYSGVVFLINPDEKCLVIIMPNEVRNMVLSVNYICFNT